MPKRRTLPWLPVFVVALLLFAGAGLYLVQSTEDEPEPTPYTFTSPHAGDQGQYATRPIRPDDGVLRLGPPEPVMSFAWKETRPRYDSAGAGHLATSLFLQTAGLEEEASFGHLVAADGTVLAHFTTTAEEALFAGAPASADTYNLHYEPAVLPCGFGPMPASIAVGTVVPWHTTCRGPAGDVAIKSLELVLRSDESALVAMQPATDATPVLLAWYQDGLPQPVRLQSGADGASSVVWDLTHFEPGDGRSVYLDAAPVPAAPALAWTPLGPEGMPDDGMDHPFPFSAAYRGAMEDPLFWDLREFTLTHPQHYVAYAGAYLQKLAGDVERHLYIWQFVVADGQDAIGVSAKREYLDTGTPEGLEVQATHYDRLSKSHRLLEPIRPTWSQLPQEQPQLASLEAQWRVYLEPETRGKTGNFWGWSITCQNACDLVEVQYRFGHDTRSIDAGGHTQTTRAILTWDEAGRPTEAEIIEGAGRLQTMRLLENPLGDQAATTATIAPRDAGLRDEAWSLPLAHVAVGAGILATLGAVLWRTWPLVQQTPLAFAFTRIRREHLLKHPVRKMLLDLVEATPGIHYKELLRRTELAKGSLEHHVKKLLDGDLLTRHAADGYTCYFLKGQQDYSVMAYASRLKSPMARRILERVAARPGASLSDLARELDVFPSQIAYHVHRLKQVNLVRTERLDGRTLCVQASQAGVEMVAGEGA